MTNQPLLGLPIRPLSEFAGGDHIRPAIALPTEPAVYTCTLQCAISFTHVKPAPCTLAVTIPTQAVPEDYLVAHEIIAPRLAVILGGNRVPAILHTNLY
jgi:hypothetical protein